VTDTQRTGPIRLWVSHLWTGREVADFSYLVAQLEEAGIDATYESLQVQPESRSPERIAQRLQSVGFDGWAYVLTHQFLTRKTCVDELILTIDQTLRRAGPNFPMLGLLHGVTAQQLPAQVRVRPCLSVGDPDWTRKVRDALEHRGNARTPSHPKAETRFLWRVHSAYGGDPSLTAIEVVCRFELIQYWRFAIPRSAQAAQWGVGPAGGGQISPVRFSVARGTGRYGSYEVSWFGAANGVSPNESAYIVFSGPLPEFVCFGPADSPSGPAGHLEIYQPRWHWNRADCS
jgi:hypothetical protein